MRKRTPVQSLDFDQHDLCAAIEDQVMAILRNNRPGTDIKGCMGPFEVYAHALHHDLVAPLLEKAGREGRISTLDDKGHRTSFTHAWNRVIRGQGETWDCRSITDVMLRICVKDVPDRSRKIMAEEFDEIDQAVISNLPRILSGETSGFATGPSTRSWVEGHSTALRFEGLQAIACNRDGLELEQPARLPACTMGENFHQSSTDAAHDVQVIMAFHGNGIEYDESQKAWGAWRSAAESAGMIRREYSESMMGMTVKSLMSLSKLGIAYMSLRQDERISVEIEDQGFRLYLGGIQGLETIVDEGEVMVARTSTWEQILTDGGFTPDAARDYLNRLAKTRSSARAHVPAGSRSKVMLDPDTLYAEHMDPYEMIYDLPREEAICIYASGTFPMPEMLNHFEREGRPLKCDAAEVSPDP